MDTNSNSVATFIPHHGDMKPIVVNSPHSGRHYPDEFVQNSRLGLLELRSSEDAYLDYLLKGCADLGIPSLSAIFPRSYVDLNRAPTEIDISMVDGKLSRDIETIPTLRSRNGLGVIPAVVSNSIRIYARKLNQEEIISRLTEIYNPYHEVLAGLLQEVHAQCGDVLLVDLHSMPSTISSITNGQTVDIVLGNRFGTTCTVETLEFTKYFFRSEGLNVALNRPYAGGFITEYYAKPEWGFETLQIEINRALYMNETSLEINHGLDELQALMTSFWQKLAIFRQSSQYTQQAAQ